MKFSAEKIILDDSVRHSIFDFPHPDNVGWNSLEIQNINERTLLIIKVWNKNEAAADVQSLRWVVYEVLPSQIKLVTDRVIQKRRSTKINGVADFINDPMIEHSINKDKKTGQLMWTAGRHSQTF
ncbi:MAG: hypothetical protein R2827_11885 [Bdellovibrionales bacterium]